MTSSTDESRRSVPQIIALVTAMMLGYLCIRTLRFSNDVLNLAFVIVFLMTPFFAISAVLRLRRWRRLLGATLLVPLLAFSSCGLLMTVSCDIPAAVEHRQLSRELSTIHQERYSVHLVWEETAGGAVGPHGVALEQRRFIVPGLYVVKHLDYFEGAYEGIISVAGTDKIRLQMPQSSNWPHQVDRVYSLKPWVYF